MHIPDGFLNAQTWIPAWIVSAGGIGYSVRKAARAVRDRFIPLMGVMAAFIFAAQMLNFPVMGGTSGHFLGGVLAAVLLGPFAGAVVIAVVLLVQCLVFQDGGLTALGANILNMSLIGTILAYYVFKLLRAVFGQKGFLAAVALAAWLSVILASTACSIELAISGTSPLKIALPAMAVVHSLIGIGEAVITVLIAGFVMKVRPDLVQSLPATTMEAGNE
jgi:cobalt/nickel transport system permease protein